MHTKQIHHAVVQESFKYIIDPIEGVVQRPVRALKSSGTTKIARDGQEYEIDPDGTFTLPADLADFLLRQPGWSEGPSPFALEAEAEEKPRAKTARKSAAA